ncbi:hypothetical protein AGMMS50222_09810 [Endomicrobiia bacterium]|nr:hypothetical protein AGMMS49556_08320 [Endomicrobiia bacterium]GHT76766.1 hypothetical protein AGMMS50222_09810 [Endomicrobiia bacterium]
MQRCKVVMLGAVVLSSLVFSSVESRADGLIAELVSEMNSIQTHIAELEARFDDYYGFRDFNAIAQSIKDINQHQRRHAEIVHTLAFYDMNCVDLQQIDLGEQFRGYDEGALREKISNDDKLLKKKHDYIEKKGETVTPQMYREFKEASKKWTLNDDE